jgi:hypothetical protein
MERNTGQSEVAQLRRRIDSKIEAMRMAMNGYAETAKHEIITHRFANLGDILEELSTRVERTTAIQILLAELEEHL